MTMADLEHLLHQLALLHTLDRGTERALWELIEEARQIGRAEMRAETQAPEDEDGNG